MRRGRSEGKKEKKKKWRETRIEGRGGRRRRIATLYFFFNSLISCLTLG
jgi:hypothetical protein